MSQVRWSGAERLGLAFEAEGVEVDERLKVLVSLGGMAVLDGLAPDSAAWFSFRSFRSSAKEGSLAACVPDVSFDGVEVAVPKLA